MFPSFSCIASYAQHKPTEQCWLPCWYSTENTPPWSMIFKNLIENSSTNKRFKNCTGYVGRVFQSLKALTLKNPKHIFVVASRQKHSQNKEELATCVNVIITNLREDVDNLAQPMLPDTIWTCSGEQISTAVWKGMCQREFFITFMLVISLQSQYRHLLGMSFRNSVGSNKIHSLGYMTSLLVFRANASSKEEMVEYYHNHNLYEFLSPTSKDNI